MEDVSSDLRTSYKCCLPFNGQEEDMKHFNNCNVVFEGVQLVQQVDDLIQLIPEDSAEVHKIVNLVLGLTCEDFVLRNKCEDKMCLDVHSLNLNFTPTGYKGMKAFCVFVKWFASKGPLNNLRILFHLLNNFPDDNEPNKFITILWLSEMLNQLDPPLRRPWGGTLAYKLTCLLDCSECEAVRILLMYNVSKHPSQDVVNNFTDVLGVYNAGNLKIYTQISCLWHIYLDFDPPHETIFNIIEDVLREYPPDLKLTKDKIVECVLKLPRGLVLRKYHLVDKFLRSYYPQNSRTALHVRNVIIYQMDSATSFESVSVDNYKSSRVKGTGEDNPAWSHWDVKEARHLAFNLVVDKYKKQVSSQEQTVTKPVGFVLKEFVDDVSLTPEQLLSHVPSPTGLKLQEKERARVRRALDLGEFTNVGKILVKYPNPAQKDLLDNLIDFSLDLLVEMNVNQLCCAVFDILKTILRSCQGNEVKGSFITAVNSLILFFYDERDFKSAMKLFKSVRLGGVNPLDHPPTEMSNEKSFNVVCSEIHFECRCFKKSIQILFQGETLKSIKYTFGDKLLEDHTLLLERLVLKMLKCFVSEKLAEHAVAVFQGVWAHQKDLNFPVNLRIFFESVLRVSFLTKSKTPCGAFEGANLYQIVDSFCGCDVTFTPVTYRKLLVDLVNCQACESVIRRVLLLCLKLKVYPVFKTTSISLATDLVLDEMYIYLLHYFQYHIAQNRGESLKSPFHIVLTVPVKTSSDPHPVPEDFKSVSNEIGDAIARLKEALKAVAGEDLPLEYSNNEVILGSEELGNLLEVLSSKSKSS